MPRGSKGTYSSDRDQGAFHIYDLGFRTKGSTHRLFSAGESGIMRLYRTSFLIALLIIASQTVFAGWPPKPGTIKGKVAATTVSESFPIAGAKLTLTKRSSAGQPISTTTNDGGEYIFPDLPSGDYILIAESDGLTSVTKEITLSSGAVLTVDINMAVTVGESVDVRIQEGLLSTSETTISNVIQSETLKTEPFRDDNYQNSLAMTPGVIRDGKDQNHLKGTRPGQSGYMVNGADVTDPVTGAVAFEMPLESAATVEVKESPYSAENGQFTGGITDVQTNGGGDKFKFAAARLFPTFRGIISSKVDSFRPRVTFSGPLVKDRLKFLQSFEYRFRRDRVTSQPKGANNITTENLNAFTQLDWTANKDNSVKFNFALFPSKVRNIDLDTFNPVETTPNYKQRGYLASASEQAVLQDGSFLSSQVSFKTFDVDVFAKSSAPYIMSPEVDQGGYFSDTRRQSSRLQWKETYYAKSFRAFGDHAVKTGFELFATNIREGLNYSPVFIQRVDGTLAQQIDFTNREPIRRSYKEAGFFVQDRWTVDQRLTLELGTRWDRDGVTDQSHFSPRFTALFLPTRKSSTVVRAGIGIFYDRTMPIGDIFETELNDNFESYAVRSLDIPARTVTNYLSDGTTTAGSPVSYVAQFDGRLRTPRSLRWSLELDQKITNDLSVRFGYLQRNLRNDLIFDPSIVSGDSPLILLKSIGRSNYKEFQFVASYNKPGFGNWNVSYVESRARGDLNTADLIYGNTPDAVLRPNQYSVLPFDSPHRLLAYGQMDFKYDIRVAPLIEIRSGFPYSAVDERLNFLGVRNGAGRFPTYFSADLQITKGVKLPFFDNKRARIGVAIFNVTNHFNPRDVQNNMTSPYFGGFYNSLGTEIKGKFDFDF